MPPLSLNQFRSIAERELVSRARFDVTINVAGLNLSGFNGLSASASAGPFLCDEAEIPGINLLTREGRTYGPEFKMPYQRSYDPVQLSFFVLRDFQSRSFFEEWMYGISQFDTNNIGYYKNFVTDITINQYSIEADGLIANPIFNQGLSLIGSAALGAIGQSPLIANAPLGIISSSILSQAKPKLIYQAVLQNAYPVRVDVMPLNWNDTDSFHKQTVNFNYENIYIPSISNPVASGYNNRLQINKKLEGALG